REGAPARPFAFLRCAVEVLGARSREYAGEITVRLVALREDPFRLRRRGATASGEPHAEVAELVMRHQQREAQALFVVVAPFPFARHVAVREVDRRADELLDRLRDGLGQSARTGTPAIVSSAM